MTPAEYIQAALRTEYTPLFIKTLNGAKHDYMLSRIMHAMLGLVSEVGELADALKKHLIYSKPLDQVNLVEEVGDVDWYRALLADALSVGFEASWEKNIAKLRARYPDKFTSERALNRDLDAERAALEGGKAIIVTVFGHDYPATVAPEESAMTVRTLVGIVARANKLEDALAGQAFQAYCEVSGQELKLDAPAIAQLAASAKDGKLYLQVARPIGYGG